MYTYIHINYTPLIYPDVYIHIHTYIHTQHISTQRFELLTPTSAALFPAPHGPRSGRMLACTLRTGNMPSQTIHASHCLCLRNFYCSC